MSRHPDPSTSLKAVAGLIGVALALGAAACGGTTVKLEMHDNYFRPRGIVGSVGETIRIELKNEGKVTHNFSVPFLGVDKDVEPGASAEVEVEMPGRNDTFYFDKRHSDCCYSGMTGVLQPSS